MVAHYGEQFHHNNPSMLTEQLYLSAARALSSSVLRDLGITCVINATIEMPTVAYQKQECMQIAVEDTISSKLYLYFDMVADKINQVHHKGGKMIVYCRAGMSRSAALCIAYFMKYHGMTVDAAFQYVRERRPIIHPNTGFMRQLRDYEKKLRTKHSQPNIHRVGDPLIRGQPMPDLVYGSEESEDNPDGENETSEIKPRPKPRIPKFKPTEVRLCCAEVFTVETAIHEVPTDPADMPPLPPSKKFRRSRKVVATPSSSTSLSASSSVRATLSVTEGSNSIAEVRSDTPLIDPGVISPQGAASTTWSPSSSFKKRLPFTKISEPAKIAVSFFVLPLCNCTPCLSVDGSHCSATSTSNQAQPYRELAQVSQEVILECPVSGLSKAVTLLDYVTDTVTVTFVTLQANNTVITQSIPIFECPGVYQYQKMDALTIMPTLGPSTSTTTPRPPPQRLQRHTATRMSLKIPGLNIRPAPEKHQKRPQFIDPDFFSVATCLPPAVLFEKAVANIGRFRPNEPSYGATVVLYAPDFVSAISSQAIVLETNPAYNRSVNLVTLSTVPSRKLLMTSHNVALSIHPTTLWNEKEMPIFVLPAREYPYYARVPRNKESESVTEKAKFASAVESTWFFPLKARPSTKSVRLAQSGVSAMKPVPELPALQWAAERSEFDIETQWREARPLLDESSEWQHAKRVSTFVERMAHITNDVFRAMSTNTLVKYVTPEAYNSWSVMRMCVYPLFGIATVNNATVLVMNNTYYEPRPFSTRANVIKMSGAIVEGLVAEQSIVSVCCDSVELVDIPDVIGDISDIRTKLVNQNDPVKLSIWLEIFKRSVLRARPVFPFVVLSESLPLADSSNTEILFETASEFKPGEKTNRPSKLPSSNLERLTFAVAKPVLNYPVVVTQWDDGSSLEMFSQVATEMNFKTKIILPPLQKASEVRNYIRDYTDLRWNQPLESIVNISEEKSGLLTENVHVAFAQTLVTAPLGCAASVHDPVCQAEVDNLSKPSLNHLLRFPFSLVTRMKTIAEASIQNDLLDEGIMASYQFVQDIEDEAIPGIVDPTPIRQHLDRVAPPVDILWFFQMETPTILRRNNGRGSQENEETEGASGGSESFLHYSLFLPDPDAVEQIPPVQIVEEAAEEPVVVAETPVPAVVVPKPTIDASDLIQGSVKSRRYHRTTERHVVINDSPPSVRRISPQPVTRLPSGLYSYQRPAGAVSRSRSGRRHRTDSVNERRTISELEASVRSASDLLERRRLAKEASSSSGMYTATSTYTASAYYPSTEPTRERGRELKRSSASYSTRSSASNVVGVTSSTPDDSPISLRGLLDFAQNWLTSHKSRREVSMERSSLLLRRSKHL